jgi:transketolase
MRLGKRPMFDLHPPGMQFEIGKAMTIREGNDATIIAIGEPTYHAVVAADLLAEEGIQCRVLSMHTLRPFDTDALLDAANTTKAIVTVEEHSVSGGLGERCASILMERHISVPFKIVGIPDEYTVTGSQPEIFDHHGISREGLAGAVRDLLKADGNS